MIGGVNTATSRIASIYNQGSQSLADTLVKIASGKKFQNAGEDLYGFARSSKLSTEIDNYNALNQELTDAKTISAAAVQVGSDVYENLTEMKNYAKKYIAETDTDKKAAYKAEFDSLKDTVAKALQNAYVDGNLVSGTGSKKIVNLDPSGTGKLDMNFTAASNANTIAAFNITSMNNTNAIDTEITASLTYMTQAKSFNKILENQLSLNSTIVTSKEAVKSLIVDIDEASEMSKMLDQNVRQQAAMSMLTQANMSREVVSKLY